MSSEPSVESSSTSQPSPGQNSALTRLEELKRSLQSMLRRRPTRYEAAARDRAALMLLRAEIAARDPKATSEDVVRLDNASRRARLDFERICKVNHTKPQRDMADIEREVAHVGR